MRLLWFLFLSVAILSRPPRLCFYSSFFLFPDYVLGFLFDWVLADVSITLSVVLRFGLSIYSLRKSNQTDFSYGVMGLQDQTFLDR